MPAPHATTLRVRYAETDQMGVVYHANYLAWCEVGRVELLRSLGFDYRSMEAEDACHIPVVEVQCRYRAPARYDDLLTIQTQVLVLRASLVRFGYRILREETLLAEAETTHVFVDAAMKKRTLPEKYAEALRRTMDAAEQP